MKLQLLKKKSKNKSMKKRKRKTKYSRYKHNIQKVRKIKL